MHGDISKRQLLIEFHRISENHNTDVRTCMLNLPNRSLAMERLEAWPGRATGENAADDERAATRTVLAR